MPSPESKSIEFIDRAALEMLKVIVPIHPRMPHGEICDIAYAIAREHWEARRRAFGWTSDTAADTGKEQR